MKESTRRRIRLNRCALHRAFSDGLNGYPPDKLPEVAVFYGADLTDLRQQYEAGKTFYDKAKSKGG